MAGFVTLLRAKAFTAEGERWIEGYATTPDTDRVGDQVDPKGAKFTLPLPLLFQHKHDEPIGAVTEAKITSRGIRIRARLSIGVKRADEVWTLVKDGALTAVSIGFLALKKSPLAGGGYLFESWDWTELSVVSVPAQPGAKISVAKGLVLSTSDLSQPKARMGRQAVIKSRETKGGIDFSDIEEEHRDKAIKAAKKAIEEHGPNSSKLSQIAMATAIYNKQMVRAIGGMMMDMERRIEAIEAKGVNYRGVYQHSDSYARGDLVTFKGSIFHCVRDVAGDFPHRVDGHGNGRVSDAWQLAVQKGRDAR